MSFSATCPDCARVYDLLPLMPKETKQATVVCSDCGCAFEVTPRPVTGLRYPRVARR